MTAVIGEVLRKNLTSTFSLFADDSDGKPERQRCRVMVP